MTPFFPPVCVPLTDFGMYGTHPPPCTTNHSLSVLPVQGVHEKERLILFLLLLDGKANVVQQS